MTATAPCKEEIHYMKAWMALSDLTIKASKPVRLKEWMTTNCFLYMKRYTTLRIE